MTSYLVTSMIDRNIEVAYDYSYMHIHVWIFRTSILRAIIQNVERVFSRYVTKKKVFETRRKNVLRRGCTENLISYDSNQIAYADWRTDLHEDLIGRTDMIERMDDRIGIRIEYGPRITTDTRIDNGSDLDLKSVEEENFWFRYWFFSDMKRYPWYSFDRYYLFTVSTLRQKKRVIRHTYRSSPLELQSFQNKSSEPR